MNDERESIPPQVSAADEVHAATINEGKMKKLFALLFGLLLTASLSFAGQTGGGAGDTKSRTTTTVSSRGKRHHQHRHHRHGHSGKRGSAYRNNGGRRPQ